MITFNEVTDLLDRQQDEGECFRECYDAIARNLLRPVDDDWCGSGGRAGTALAIFRIREWTTRRAGVPTLGFQKTLQKLAALLPDDRLIQCSLDAPDRIYLLFVAEASWELIGCIRVMRRLGNGLAVARRHRQQCPCRGYYTLSRRGAYDICPVCFWEDADAMEVFGQPAPERTGGANAVQLWQARENFLVFGAAEERCKPYVRSPHTGELP